MTSIARKIHFGFYAFATATVALALLAYIDLRFLKDHIDQGVAVSGFLDAVLEMRRFEKNLFLYNNPSDYTETRAYADKALRLLRTRRSAFLAFAPGSDARALEQTLADYHRLITDYGAVTGANGGPRLEVEGQIIREAGHRVAEQAERLAQAQRAHLIDSVSRAGTALLISFGFVALLGVLIARLLSRAAVQPLQRLQGDLAAIGEGRYDQLKPPSKDREIISMTRAVNQMLGEIDARQRHLIQSEKLASLGTLVSGVAHELNNPLSNISTSCQILLEETGNEHGGSLREWLRQIDEETERARHIVQVLLEFSRERSFRKIPVALRQLIGKALLLLGRQFSEQVHVQIDVPEELVVVADPQRLNQICVNLIRNALDAGGPGMRITIGASVESGRDFRLPDDTVFGQVSRPSIASEKIVVLHVEDNGPGIPQDVLPRVFDPFFTTKEIGHGSGLGLFVTQELVHQHGGCIGVSSRAGQGTRFTVCLPDETTEIAA